MEGIHFDVKRKIDREFTWFRAENVYIIAKLKTSPENINPIEWFKVSIAGLLEYVMESADEQDMVGLRIKNHTRYMKYPVDISLRRKKDVNMELIWEAFNKSGFVLRDNLSVYVDVVKMP